MLSLAYILSAALGLGFLIFIHELGHYLVAKRVGMRIEVFSIGFGKPIKVWKRNGEIWQICYLPFGGYVKMAGMDAEDGQEPSEIRDGFWGRTPMDRIKVALAGPVVNLAFALAVFGLMWMGGGREKSFAEYTHRIGWVEPSSELYAAGFRPGDTIVSYDGRAFTDYKDHLYAAMLSDAKVT
ncbi:MAG: site-2 protease family protein, partial [Chlamydiia bacterium]|nr:site-2 protease family protein [Chlamydiia bacterium]